jgi:two-component system sensor histidine kinase KdpD
MRTQSRSPLVGLVVAVAAVAATTAVIFALRPHVPVLSTSVLYLIAVLLVSSTWGLWLGLLTSLASALAFNFFHIPPTGRFTISDPSNFIGLAVYLVAAVVVSAYAGAARARAEEAERRRREADLTAELAQIVLGGDGSLETAATRIGDALGVEDVRLAETWIDSDPGHRSVPLVAAGERVGTLILPRDAPREAFSQLGERIAPALGALIAARRRRTVLEAEVVETKALRRSDVLKTALLRAVSHDLRSPLTAIRAAAGGIDSATVDPDQRRELKDVIETETERLTRLVDDLLDLSRLESGTAEPHPEPSSVEEVVDAVAAAHSLRNAKLDIQLDGDLPPVQADPVQLERALSNLVENAIRHSTNGAPVAVRASMAGARLQLRVTDRGPGIAPGELERIFEPFYRAPGASGRGSGLGLAIAKGFVEGNGGRLWARSLPGQGSTFTIDLPLA